MAPVAIAHALKRDQLHDAVLTLVPHGHFLMLEDPAAFAAAALRFWKDLDQGRR